MPAASIYIGAVLLTSVFTLALGEEPALTAATAGGGSSSRPEWITGSRLLKLGEAIDFHFFLPDGIAAGPVEVFPRYLEQARPGEAFVAGQDPTWLDRLEPERIALSFKDGRASVTYRPRLAGSYLARWRAGGEVSYRYFAAVEQDWVVLRFSTFGGLESKPTLHGTGIPLDYRLPVDRFRKGDPLFEKFLGYHRRHGDTIIPAFPDTPDLTVEQRVDVYGKGLKQVRALMPDPSNARTIRVEMRHDLDTGYTETFRRLGVNEHCGLNEANAKPWLGMPEFPYFSSPVDCRKTHQGEAAQVVAHQWDFCGGWHFIGPVAWHYRAAEGDWTATEKCLRRGLDELKNLASMSGHPAFAVPLYDGVVGEDYPNPSFEGGPGSGTPRCFKGCVDDVFVVGRALSEEDIARVAAEGASGLKDAIAVWTFDEGSGRHVADGSGRGHTADLINDPQWVPGKSGKALSFDGQDDSVATRVPVPVKSEDFTLGCWVKPAATQCRWANLLSSHNSDGGTNYRGLSLEQDDDRTNRFYLIAGKDDRWVGQAAATQLQADVWQHFAVVRRGTSLTHYLNGKVSAKGPVPGGVFPPATNAFRIANWARGSTNPSGERDMLRFVDRYQRFIAFDVPKHYRLAYARSIDIADYYRRHFRVTPRTVFVSKTDHVLYDMWWLCNWCGPGLLVPRELIPWSTRMSSVFEMRDRVHPFKDPLSYEYVLVEDQKRSIRFERECPNPIWWFDYTQQSSGPKGSEINYTRTPDVDIRRSGWVHDPQGWTMTLRMRTTAEFRDYAICLWGLPAEALPNASRIRTNAKEFILARNTDGQQHLVLFFDLKPHVDLSVVLLNP